MAIDAEEPDRRDFLVLAASAFVAVGGAVTLWPFIQQMNPDAGAQALASIEVDLAPVKEGQAITVMWRGKPVFIRNRTKEEIESANAVAADGSARRVRAQRRAARRRAGDRRQPHQEGPRELAGPGRHLHASRLHPQGPVAGRQARAISAAGSAPATARTTTPPDASARVRRRAISRCRLYEFVSDTKIKIG